MSRPKILIVEDERIIAEDLRQTLRRLGYQVVGVAASGNEALKIASEEIPDLALMDIMLRGKLDGITVAQRLKDRFDVPSIYLTAYADKQILKRAKITAPYGYIIKPFDEKELHTNIEIALERNRIYRLLKRTNSILRTVRNINQLIVRERDRQKLIQQVCKVLTREKGYPRAWIALLDENNRLIVSAQSGWGRKFRDLTRMLKQGEMPDCAREAMKGRKIVLGVSAITCKNCPFRESLPEYNMMTCALMAHRKRFGFLSVVLPEKMLVDKTEQELFREVAGDVAFGLYDIELEERRHQLEEAVQKSEEKYRTLTESARESIYVIGRDERIEYVNPFGATQLGKKPAEIVGKRQSELFPPEIAEEQSRHLKKVFRTGKESITENISQYQERKVWLNNMLIPLRDHRGKVTAVMGVSRDITEQKEAERALEESEARFKTLSESSAEGIVIHDRGVIRDVNSTYCRMFGYKREEVLGKNVLQFAAPESRELVLKNVRRGYEKPYEAVGLRKDGSTFIVEVIGKPIPYKGRTVRATVIRDITTRKQMERTLQLVMEGTSAATGVHFFKNLVRSIARVLDTKIAFLTRRDPSNPQLVRTLAICQNGQIGENIEWEVKGTPCEEVIKGESVVITRKVQQKFPTDIMLREVNAESYLAVPIRDANGNVVGHLGILDTKPLDIPENLENIVRIFAVRAGTELQRLQSEEELESIFTSSPLPILTLDDDRIIQNSNSAAQEYCHKVSEEVTGQRMGDVLLCIHRLDDPQGCGFGPDCEHCFTRKTILDTFFDQRTRRGVESEMLLLIDNEPTSRTIRLSTSYFDSLVGPRVIVMFDDITEQKKMQAAVNTYLERLKNLHEFVEKLNRAVTFEEAYATGIKSILQVLGADRASILLADPDDVVRFKAWEGLSQDYREAVEGHFPWRFSDLKAKPIWISDVTESDLSTTIQNTVLKEGIHACAFVPLVGEKRLLGKFMIYYNQVHPFETNEMDIVQVLADNLATVLERLQGRKALVESETRYRHLVETSPDAVVMTDLEGNITYVSQRALELYGAKTAKEMLGRNTLEFFPPEEVAKATEGINRTLSEGILRNREYLLLRKDGSVYPCEMNVSLVKDEKGNPSAFIATMRDVTERKQIQDEILRLKEFNESIVTGMAEGVVVLDADGNMEYINPASERLLGYTRSELEGQHWSLIIPEDQHAIVHTEDKRREKGESSIYDLQLVRKDGRRIDVRVSGSPRFKRGEFIGTLAVFADITEQKQMLKTLEASEAFNRTVLTSVSEGVIVYDRDFRYVVWNSFMESMTGYQAKDVLGKCAFDLFPFLKEQGIDKLLKRALKGETTVSPDIHFVIPGTEQRGWVVSTYSPHYDAEGKIVGVVGLIRDITERKKAEEELRRTHENLNNLFRYTTDAIIIQNRKQEILDCNTATEELFGYSRKELITDPEIQLSDFAKTDDTQKSEYTNKAFQGQPQRFEWWGKKKDGTSFPEEILLNRTIYNGEEVLFVTIRDITERKQAEDEVRKLAVQRKELLEMGREITASLETETVLKTVLEEVRTLLNCNGATIYMLDEDEQTLTPIMTFDPPYEEQVMATTVNIDASLTGKVIKAKKGMIFNYASKQPGSFHIPGTPDDENDHIISTPFVVGNKAIGALTIYRKKEEFTEADLALAETFALYASTAINNARMYEELQTQVSERKQAEEALRRSEANLIAAQRIAHVGSWEWDLATDTAHWSDETYCIFGVDRIASKDHRQDFLNRIHPDDRSRVDQALTDAIQGTREYDVEYRVVLPDKGERIIHARAEVIRDDHGEALKMLGTVHDITERKQAEEALRNSEDRYRSILESIEEGYYEVDLKGNFTFFNDSLCKMLDYSRDELLGMNNRQYMDYDSAKRVYEVFNHVFKTGKSSKTIEIKIKKNTGEIKFGEISVSLLKDKNNKPIGFRGIVRDITDRRQTEEERRRSEENLRNLFRFTTDAIIIQNRDREILDCNAAAEKLFGYTREELLADITIQLADLDRTDETKRIKYLEKALQGKPQRFEWWGKRKDGSTFPEEILLNRTIYNGEEVVFVTIRDITERKKAEEALAESEEKFRTLVENAPTGILTVDTKGNITQVNQKLLEILGSPSIEETMKINILKYKPLEKAGATAGFRKVFKTGEPVQLEHEYTSKWGKTSYLRYKVVPIRDDKGNIIGAQANIEDATEEWLAQQEIATLADALKSIHEFVSITDQENKLLFVNAAFLKAYGYTREEVIGHDIQEIVGSDKNPPETVKEILPATIRGGWQGELINRRKDGSEFPVSLSTSPIKNKEGKIVALIGVAEDITEQKVAQEQLLQSEKSFRGLYDNASDAIYIQDREGKFVDVNQGAVKMYGYPKEFFIGKTPEPLSAPGKNDMKKIAKYIEKAFKGEPQEFEFWGRRNNGEIFPKIVRLTKGVYFGQEVVIAFATDIKDRKLAETKLKESEEKFRSLFEESRDVIYISTAEGELIDINKAGEKLFGYTKEEMLTINGEELYVNKEDRKRFFELIKHHGFVEEFEVPLKKKDGTIVYCLVTTICRKTAEGIEQLQGIIHDISKRKLAEEALQKKIKDLDRANKLMVGRELRMIELKREVNELLEKAGHPKKYKTPGEIEQSISRSYLDNDIEE